MLTNEQYPHFGFYFDIISWAWIIAEANNPGESVQTVSNGKVKCLAEYAISLTRIGDDLRIASRHVEYHRVLRTSNETSHLNICEICIRAYRGETKTQIATNGPHNGSPQRVACQTGARLYVQQVLQTEVVLPCLDLFNTS